ncbi:MAG: endonuclease/exonuclease/phosphatase family protein [Alloprevotella sp.]
MEYNVENLFDTVPAALRQDESFTPQGAHRWTTSRYWHKQGGLARTIAAAGGSVPVDLVALIEVENDSVVRDLTRRTALARSGYDYVVTRSPDPRGINVALLYQPARFRPVSVDTLRVAPPHRRQLPTRDVLHVAGETVWGDTLDVLVCHLPSRRGAGGAEAYRDAVCRRMRSFADSLLRVRRRPAIVLTGDFNAGWPEACLTRHLDARLPEAGRSHEAEELYVLSHGLFTPRGVAGTYYYRSSWCRLDHFVVNGGLLGAQRRRGEAAYGVAECRILDFDFLLRAGPGGDVWVPAPTFRGTMYAGGYSDHLPLMLTLHPAAGRETEGGAEDDR